MGADLVGGHGRLDGPRRVAVETRNDGRVVVFAQHAVAVCTGSRAALPDLPGIARSGPGLAATPRPQAQCPSGLPSLAAAASGPRWPVLTRAWAPPSPYWSPGNAGWPGCGPLSHSWTPGPLGRA